MNSEARNLNADVERTCKRFEGFSAIRISDFIRISSFGIRISSFATLLLLLTGCASPGSTSQSKTVDGDVVTTFDDAAHGLRLTYPGDWEEVSDSKKPANFILMLAPPSHNLESKFQPIMAVLAPSSETTVTPEDLPAMQERTIEKQQREFTDFKLISAAAASVGGEPARRMICTGSKLGQPLEVMYVLTTHGGKPFSFNLMSEPDEFTTQRTEAEKVIESAQWMR